MNTMVSSSLDVFETVYGSSSVGAAADSDVAGKHVSFLQSKLLRFYGGIASPRYMRDIAGTMASTTDGYLSDGSVSP